MSRSSHMARRFESDFSSPELASAWAHQKRSAETIPISRDRICIRIRGQYVHYPNGPSERILGCDGKIVQVAKLNVGSGNFSRSKNPQNILVDGPNSYSMT